MFSHTVILDGFLGRPRRWEPLRRAIQARGGTASIHFYDSTGRTDLPTLGRQLYRDLSGASWGALNLVGYSMGGMVIRAARLLHPDFAIDRAVFVNCPHRGTRLAYLWPLVGVRQMRPGDPFLARLNAAAWDVPTLTVFNHGFDGIVFPASSTHWPPSGVHVCSRVPLHIWPVWSRPIHRRIAAYLYEREPLCLSK